MKKITNHKSQVVIVLLLGVLFTTSACKKSESLIPNQSVVSAINNDDDPKPDDVVIDNLNENYKLGTRYSSHHISCKRGGHNCYQDGFIDPIGHGKPPVIVQPDPSVIWFIFENDSTDNFDTLIVDLED